MNTYAYHIRCFILAILGLIGASSCTQEDDYPMEEAKDVNLRITVQSLSKQKVTRIASERTDRSRIEDMNIVLANGKTINNIIYIPQGTNALITDISQTGLVSGALPTDGGTLEYHISKNDLQNSQDIYVVCNFRNISKDGTVDPTGGDLNKYLKNADGTYKTVDQLKMLRQGTVFKTGNNISTLFGQAVATSQKDVHGGRVYEAVLKRTTAMITVSMAEIKDLQKGVRIVPKQVRLCNVPFACHIGMPNAGNKLYRPNEVYPPFQRDIPIYKEGLLQSLGSWGDLQGGDGELSVLGGTHDASPEVIPLFMFENMQGNSSDTTVDPQAKPNTNEVVKKPLPGKENFCTYLELEAQYYYMPEAGKGQQVAGRILYRLYLGKDIYSDFNIERNKHYQITLQLSGMGGLEEDGRFHYDKDGVPVFDASKGGASWRIETDANTAGFIDGVTDISVSGSFVVIPFVKEEGKKYYIYSKTNDGTSFLKTEVNQTGEGEGFLASPSGGLYAIPKQNEETGQWYIELFAAGFVQSNWETTFGAGIKNWTVEQWVSNGYRTETLVLEAADKSFSNEIVLRQWLPLPVMEPGITKPWDAHLYVSRQDAYEGQVFPWGPTFYNVNWDASQLQTQNLGTNDQYQTFVYQPTCGFDNTVAFYVTDRNGGKHIPVPLEYPESAMEIAVFRAGNANGNSQQMEGRYYHMLYYGLPTKEEWDRIHRYVVEDHRFPFAPTEYWTSSMEGTQSYVYDYVTDKASLADRTEEHRVRMVYHKSEAWISSYDLP